MKIKLTLILILIVTLLSSSCASNNQIQIEPLRLPELCTDIVDVSAAKIGWDIESISNYNSKEIKLYRKAQVRKDAIWDSLIDVYEFGSDEEEKDNNIYVYNGDAVLEYNELGFIRYRSMDDDVNSIVTLTQNEMTDTAVSTLENIGIDMSNFKVCSVSEYSCDDRVYRTDINFNYMIDGYDVIGQSMVSVGFMNDNVTNIMIAYSELEEAFDAEIKPESKLHVDIEKNALNYIALIETEYEFPCTAEIMNVDSIEIVYIDQCYDQEAEFVQPYFRITGTLVSGDTSVEYSALVPALTDSYYKYNSVQA